MIQFRTMLLAGVAAMSLAGAATTGSAWAEDIKEVQMLHWWTSGGEAAALNVLKQDLAKEGYAWKDVPVAGGGGEAAMTTLKAMVAAGNPPTASQILGYFALDYAEAGKLGDVTELATKEGWDKSVPAALQKFTTTDGKWGAVPVNIHSVNWVWIYKKAFIDLDESALTSDTMKKAFDNLAKLRDYTDPNYAGRDWNLATAMVINGEALVQVMGDWAKGEFNAAKKVAGTDFLCYRFPGTDGDVIYNTDMFAMFDVSADRKAAQLALADATMSPSFQSAFNVIKGSVPARMDVPDTDFDMCGKKGMADVKAANANGKFVGSMGQNYAQPPAVAAAYHDVVTKFFHGEIKTSADAVKELYAALEAAK